MSDSDDILTLKMALAQAATRVEMLHVLVELGGDQIHDKQKAQVEIWMNMSRPEWTIGR